MSKKTKVGLALGLVILVALLAVVVRIVGLGLVAALWHTPVEPDLDFLFEIALREQDLPSGWVLVDASVEEIPGGEGRIYLFTHHQLRGQLPYSESIRQDVLVYPDEESAIEGFRGFHNELLPSEIARDAPELMISHSADQVEVGCWLGPYVGEEDFCVFISRYGRVVIIVDGEIRSELLTTEAFRGVLEVANQRAVLAIEGRQ
jgi:hypothetical protein